MLSELLKNDPDYEGLNVSIGSLCKRQHRYLDHPFSVYVPNGKSGKRLCLACKREREISFEKQNREKRNIQHRQYYQNNPENQILAVRNWKVKNHLAVLTHARLGNAKYRARKEQAIQIPFTESAWIKKWKYEFQGCCGYCGKRIFWSELQQDHLIPRSDVYNEHSLRNLIPSCKQCNTSKGDSNVFNWLAWKGWEVPKWLQDLIS